MTTRQPGTSPRWGVGDTVALVFLLAQGLSLLLAAPLVLQGLSVAFAPEPGDAMIGVTAVAMCMGGLGALGLLVSVPLAACARALPLWARFLLVLCPVTALVLAGLMSLGP